MLFKSSQRVFFKKNSFIKKQVEQLQSKRVKRLSQKKKKKKKNIYKYIVQKI